MAGPADVEIVGGGVTGISAALTLARAGKRVRVHEARSVASGAPDLMPVVGPHPSRAGVWVAGGYSRHGNVLGLISAISLRRRSPASRIRSSSG